MSLWGKLNKALATMEDIAVNDIAPKVGKVIGKVGKVGAKVIDEGAGGLNKTIIKSKEFVGKVKSGEVGEALSDAGSGISKAILSDNESYRRVTDIKSDIGKQIGDEISDLGQSIGNKLGINRPLVSDGLSDKVKRIGKKISDVDQKIGNAVGADKVLFSKKPLILDELNSELKGLGDKAAGIFDYVTRDNFTIGGKEIFKEHNPFKLLKKDEGSLIGWRATKRGAALAIGGALVAGVPGATKEFIQSRQGTNMDMQPVTPAPSIPAYANNGGATGDLVFALNNLRHGGMM